MRIAAYWATKENVRWALPAVNTIGFEMLHDLFIKKRVCIKSSIWAHCLRKITNIAEDLLFDWVFLFAIQLKSVPVYAPYPQTQEKFARDFHFHSGCEKKSYLFTTYFLILQISFALRMPHYIIVIIISHLSDSVLFLRQIELTMAKIFTCPGKQIIKWNKYLSSWYRICSKYFAKPSL